MARFFFSPPPNLPEKATEIYLSQRPIDHITSETFSTRQTTLPPSSAFPPTSLLVRVLYVSCDPAMRGWLSTRRSYIEPVAVGATMRAMGIGEVIHPAGRYKRGNIVHGMFGWTDYALVDASKVTSVKIPAGVPISAALGVLGTTGMTAYFGLLHVGKITTGDVVVVSAAAGATGSVVAQIAKNVYGCKVIGIAGGPVKCRYLEEELGILAVDYKSEEGVDGGLKRALNGDGIDIYYDNVGGATLEAALRRISIGARIVICGAISVYNSKSLQPGPKNYLSLIANRASMTGFILFDFEKKFAIAARDLSKWIVQGKIKSKEYEVVGLENAPQALLSLFEGKNIGKVIVRVEEQTKDMPKKINAKL